MRFNLTTGHQRTILISAIRTVDFISFLISDTICFDYLVTEVFFTFFTIDCLHIYNNNMKAGKVKPNAQLFFINTAKRKKPSILKFSKRPNLKNL